MKRGGRIASFDPRHWLIFYDSIFIVETTRDKKPLGRKCESVLVCEILGLEFWWIKKYFTWILLFIKLLIFEQRNLPVCARFLLTGAKCRALSDEWQLLNVSHYKSRESISLWKKCDAEQMNIRINFILETISCATFLPAISPNI